MFERLYSEDFSIDLLRSWQMVGDRTYSVAVLNANCFETFRNDSLQRTYLFKVNVVTSFSKSIENKRVVKLSSYGLCYAYLGGWLRSSIATLQRIAECFQGLRGIAGRRCRQN